MVCACYYGRMGRTSAAEGGTSVYQGVETGQRKNARCGQRSKGSRPHYPPKAFRRLKTRPRCSSPRPETISALVWTHFRGCADRAHGGAALRLNEDLTEAIALAHDLGILRLVMPARMCCGKSTPGVLSITAELRVVDHLEQPGA